MRSTIEESPRIDAAELAGSKECRRALEGDGGPAEVTVSCRDVSGRQDLSLCWLVQKGAAQLTSLSDLAFETELGCVVPIKLAPGGIAFFRFPGDGCARRVRHLYLVEGLLRCRHCHRLIYRCQVSSWGPHWDQDGLEDEEGEAGDPNSWAAAQELERERRLREEAQEREASAPVCGAHWPAWASEREAALPPWQLPQGEAGTEGGLLLPMPEGCTVSLSPEN